MSASQEKKARERAEREEKRLQQEKADRRAMTLYTVVGAVVVLAAIVMMVWSSGVIQRGMTAVEVGGEKLHSFLWVPHMGVPDSAAARRAGA